MHRRTPWGENTQVAVTAFVAVAYALSIALSLVIGLTGGNESPFIGLRFASMLLPAAALVVVGAATKEKLRIDWNRLPLRYLPLAFLLLPVVIHVAMLPVIASYEGRLPWEHWLTPRVDGLYHSPPQRGWGALTRGGLAGRIVVNAVVGVTIASTLAFFEEVGWRGWLLPRLGERMGIRSAVVLTSAIWAVWHVPFQLSGIQHVDGVPPGTLALTLPIAIFATGLVIGWLWVKTQSIWIVSVAHGALDAWGQYAPKYMQFVHAPDAVVGLAGLTAVLVLGTMLLMWGMVPVGRTHP